MTETNVPRLRFREFDGEWKDSKLSDIGTIFGGLTGKTKEDFGHGKSSYLTYLNVNRKFVSDISCTELVDVDDCEKQNQIQKNDVLFTISSETPEEVGLSSTWIDDCSAYLNSFSFGYRFKNKTDGYYTASLFRSQNARKKIFPLAQGISRYNLSKSNFLKLSFNFAELSEQQQIGSFFEKMDNLIELQTKKLEQLKKLKQGYLQKMFPQGGESLPKFRFSGFSGEWKKQGLLNLAKLRTGSRNAEDGVEGGKFLFFDRSSEIKFLNEYDFDGEVIVYAGEGSKFLPRKFNGKYSLHQRAYGIYDLKNINFEFLYQELLNKNNHFLKYAVGTTAKSLRKDCFEKLIVKYPSVDEQQQIGSFLSKLDQIINDQSDKIDELKRQKKAYLQKMFI